MTDQNIVYMSYSALAGAMAGVPYSLAWLKRNARDRFEAWMTSIAYVADRMSTLTALALNACAIIAVVAYLSAMLPAYILVVNCPRILVWMFADRPTK